MYSGKRVRKPWEKMATNPEKTWLLTLGKDNYKTQGKDAT